MLLTHAVRAASGFCLAIAGSVLTLSACLVEFCAVTVIVGFVGGAEARADGSVRRDEGLGLGLAGCDAVETKANGGGGMKKAITRLMAIVTTTI